MFKGNKYQVINLIKLSTQLSIHSFFIFLKYKSFSFFCNGRVNRTAIQDFEHIKSIKFTHLQHVTKTDAKPEKEVTLHIYFGSRIHFIVKNFTWPLIGKPKSIDLASLWCPMKGVNLLLAYLTLVIWSPDCEAWDSLYSSFLLGEKQSAWWTCF